MASGCPLIDRVALVPFALIQSIMTTPVKVKSRVFVPSKTKTGSDSEEDKLLEGMEGISLSTSRSRSRSRSRSQPRRHRLRTPSNSRSPAKRPVHERLGQRTQGQKRSRPNPDRRARRRQAAEGAAGPSATKDQGAAKGQAKAAKAKAAKAQAVKNKAKRQAKATQQAQRPPVLPPQQDNAVVNQLVAGFNALQSQVQALHHQQAQWRAQLPMPTPPPPTPQNVHPWMFYPNYPAQPQPYFNPFYRQF